ncbi:diguanylate cyclase (GGDEF) domain-containing protein [Thioflavicoccus mobilis 8321]|uniref:diguanylate cyclase n=1 Tax=Thioflavicoccus mobilis 8321 TaxID=765912 RepID=L0H1H9_9GAMM|nr:diguanylate cyclase [Thioflavicoccus mobilis]AGA92071.1 diguanylate cyclase (GGDEF) domain-containing protein [Thioflavicoccus mobilis 8321]
MSLNRKITLLLGAFALGILVTVGAISLYAFRSFSIVSSTAHVKTAAEIVRVYLTESMINGVIDKREQGLNRLSEVYNLRTARVVRSDFVNRQFGPGLSREMVADPIEARVLADGKARFEVDEKDGAPLFRGTVPYIASARGEPNCLQCHAVEEGTVLGVVTIELSLADLRRRGAFEALAVVLAVSLISVLAIVWARRLILPVGDTAAAIGEVVQRALQGDFKGRISQRTRDDIGQIAAHMNRMLAFVDQGLSQISERVSQLTGRPPHCEENQLQATIDMVENLTDATRFKATIEEDEAKTEIYERFGRLLAERFGVCEYSIYEVNAMDDGSPGLVTIAVDGVIGGACRWCDPQILLRSDLCRARRSGHPVDGLLQPGICLAFQPAETDGVTRRHHCLPIIQSGTVGSVIQLVTSAAEAPLLQERLAFLHVYLREMAPVLEAKRLTETLRDSSLRDAMTGLHNRRFLEEYIDTLVRSARRRDSRLVLLMLDLDYFKMVNDTYGHDVGDTVLNGLAGVLQESVRASDILVRFGGEEFLIVLQDAVPEDAVKVAEKIRHRVGEFKFQIADGVLQKTISIGVAVFPDDSETFWQVLKYADVALYRAKETGRDRVVRFTADMWKPGTDLF